MSPQMTTTDAVKQCPNVKEALLVLAAAIDALHPPADPWAEPLDWGGPPSKEDLGVPVDEGRSQIINGEVVVKPVSEVRQVARNAFFNFARLGELIEGLAPADARAAYIAGGPRWLYYTNRDAVMALPVAQRQAMIADVLIDSPAEADEIGRDILKFAFDEGGRETEQLEALRRDYGPVDA